MKEKNRCCIAVWHLHCRKVYFLLSFNHHINRARKSEDPNGINGFLNRIRQYVVQSTVPYQHLWSTEYIIVRTPSRYNGIYILYILVPTSRYGTRSSMKLAYAALRTLQRIPTTRFRRLDFEILFISADFIIFFFC